MSNSSTSISKKDNFPKNDKQVDNVYHLDHKIENYIKEYNIKELDNYSKHESFLVKSKIYFENEGFNNLTIFDSQSDKTSFVNINNQELAFSKPAIKINCVETIIHELAHAVCSFHLGYNYADHHNEIFVNVLFSLLVKYLNISNNILEHLADKFNVRYFYNFNFKISDITKNQYEERIEYCKKNYVLIKDCSSKKNDFINHVFLNKNKKITIMFKNSNGVYKETERDLLKFEEDLYINKFLDFSKRDLINLKIISPIVKIYPDGTISKNAKIIAYQSIDINNVLNNSSKYKVFQIKESASIDRSKELKLKKSGYRIIQSKSIEQHFAFVKHLRETVVFLNN